LVEQLAIKILNQLVCPLDCQEPLRTCSFLLLCGFSIRIHDLIPFNQLKYFYLQSPREQERLMDHFSFKQ